MQCEGSAQAISAINDLCMRGGEAIVTIRVPVPLGDERRARDQSADSLDPYYDAMLQARLRVAIAYGDPTELRALVSSQREFQALRGKFAEWLGGAIAKGLQVKVERPTEYTGF